MRRHGERAAGEPAEGMEQLFDGRAAREAVKRVEADFERRVARIEDGGGGTSVRERTEEEPRPERRFDVRRGTHVAHAQPRGAAEQGEAFRRELFDAVARNRAAGQDRGERGDARGAVGNAFARASTAGFSASG